jgi:hypothetical protein
MEAHCARHFGRLDPRPISCDNADMLALSPFYFSSVRVPNSADPRSNHPATFGFFESTAIADQDLPDFDPALRSPVYAHRGLKLYVAIFFTPVWVGKEVCLHQFK